MPDFRPPEVSVIIPHLNQPDMLARCLEGIAAQAAEIGGVELIVVDNGSASLPEQICSRVPNTRLLSEVAPGPGPARNRGISEAKGAILAFIDADCYPDGKWLETILAHFADPGQPDIVGGDVRIGRLDQDNPTGLETYESVFAYRQKYYITRLGFSGTGNLAMRRAAFFEVGPFGGIEIAEDRDWGRRATRKGYKISYCPEMIVYHPARQSFAELQKKWDRHVSHDFEEKAVGMSGKLKWIVLTGAVLASSLLDAWKVLTSDRLSTITERLLAIGVLVRIRIYRAWRMVATLFSNAPHRSHRWNRG